MDEIAVINASPLILLSRSKKLQLLRQFSERILYLHRRVLDEALKRVGE